MVLTQRVFQLKGVVQHYTWGGFFYIPQLLNMENKEEKPFAEYWLGAHPNHPSQIEKHPLLSLDKIINENPATILGENVFKKFQSLPYLLKVLDVRQMLSIQVHPDKKSAEQGFEDENKKGIAVYAYNRNYKDDNHKPEMAVALGNFYLLHGFKEEKLLENILVNVVELNFLRPVFKSKGYKGLYEEVMLMPQEKVNKVLQPLGERTIPLYKAGQLQKNNEDFWAARAAVHSSKNGNYDRGIFSIYFFNLVHLKDGEGIYQPEGLPHAYLEGQNIELMANSDNVLRAGLTDKYIDVEELMKYVRFEATIPIILKGKGEQHKVYHCPVEEFELHSYEVKSGSYETIDATTADIVISTQGESEIQAGSDHFLLKKGEALLLTAGTRVEIRAKSDSRFFRATVPGGAKN
ncbi:MAG: mannose-6-phosphate isomerase, class I [Flavisolibacter sp.]